MYLKAVEIYGFKSFGERVYIDFDKGITSIIGPNGSGKSNILDAVLWVLGEQSYKNIRAKESLDVVFSGGKNLKPMNSAEVSLIMDNSDRYFPIERDIVKVTRKITVKGKNSETEYFINDERARLKDISTMFLDTGIGKSAYSVIGQGRVERIISASPKERKSIIEEAAGIKKFQISKAETQKNLENMQKDVEQLEFVKKEVKDRKNLVEKQAEKAEKYVKIRDKRNTLAKSVYQSEYNLKKFQWAQCDINKEKINKAIEELVAKETEYNQKIESIRQEQANLNAEIEELDAKNKSINEEISDKKSSIAATEQRIKNYADNTVEKNGRIAELDKKIKEKEEEIENEKRLQSTNNGTIEALTKETEELDKVIKAKEQESSELQTVYDAKTDQIGQKELQKMQQQSEADSAGQRKKSSQNAINRIKEEIKKWEKNNADITQKISDKDKEKIQCQAILQEKEEKDTFLTNEDVEASKKFTALGRQIVEAQKNLDIASNRLNTLSQAEEENAGYSPAVKEVLNANISGVEGTLLELITIPQEYEKAIVSAAGGNLQDIITITTDVAKRCMAVLNEKRAGRASFWSLDNVKSNNRKSIDITQHGVIGLASNLVSCDDKYAKLIDSILGSILVVEDFDVAVSVSKSNIFFGTIVTLNGETVSGKGRMTGGTNNKQSLGTVLLERKRQIAELTETVKTLTKQIDTDKDEYETLRKAIETFENELEQIRYELKEAKDKFNEIEKEQSELVLEQRRLEVNRDTMKQDLEREERYIAEYDKNIDDYKTKFQLLEDTIATMKADRNEDEKKLNEIKQELKEIQTSFTDKRVLLGNIINQREQNGINIDAAGRSIHEYREEQRQMRETIEMNGKFSEEAKKDIEKLNEEIKLLLSSLDNSENKLIRDKKDEITKLEENAEKLRTKLLDIREEKANKENDIERNAEKSGKLQADIAQLEEELEPLADIEGKDISEKELSEAKAQFKKIDREFMTFGDVNVSAIEEYEQQKKRYEEVTAQLADLTGGRDKLLGMIKDLETTIKERFFTAYGEISRNFNVMCADTLDNSEGKLELVNPENFDDCGIEIFVKFKNKKRQSLSLLSGGEKSMVAIAFVISIFMYKPSPFTFLDEIEAALDETNTTKLLKKLREFTDKSQFILITHNKTTMSKSDTILGVSMNKDIGLTKILGVNVLTLDEYIKKNKGVLEGAPSATANKKISK